MRLDLSSHITLDRVPKKYYKPENDFEEYNLARYEKLPVAIFEEFNSASVRIAEEIVNAMMLKQQKGDHFVKIFLGEMIYTFHKNTQRCIF